MAIRKLNAAPGDDELLELKHVCAMVKAGETTVRKWMRAGTFPRPKKAPSGAMRWTRGQIRRWTAELPDVELTDTPKDLATSPIAGGVREAA